MVEQKTLADVEKMVAAGATPELVNIPLFYVSSVRVAPSPVNFNLVFSRIQAVNFTNGNERIHAGALVDVLGLDMSPQAAKDLALILKAVVDQHEKEWGPLETEFTRKVSEEAKAAASAPNKSRF
ncbi:DUF3467 domain-containing protein [Mesorhizobium sp. M0902]|uniref:hypothetical protein n=1 Tax=unclassified Mesorhizobium TaxID=325217 RepID=UPI0033369D86